MLPFSPETSRLWQTASFCLIYSSIVGVISRLIVLIGSLLFILVPVSSGVDKLPYLAFSALGLFVMFELYFRYKLQTTLPSTTVEQISAKTNLADVVSLDLAKILLRYPFWTNTESLVKALTKSPKANFIINRTSINSRDLKEVFSAGEGMELNALLQDASGFAAKEGDNYIEVRHLVISLFGKSKMLQKLLFEKELKIEDLVNIGHWEKSLFEEENTQPFWKRPTESLGLGLASLWSGGWTLETEKYTKEITAGALSRGGDFLVGHEREIRQAIGVLARDQKRNILLLGEPGIGKTSIVYSLARASFLGQLPTELSYKRFLELDVVGLTAGNKEGEIEQRVKNILDEVTHARDVVLFVNVFENFTGALENGKYDLSGLLATSLENPNLQIVGTSDRANYHQFIENKKVFADHFEVIDIVEPTETASIKILEEAAVHIEAKHKTLITYTAIKKTVELVENYIVDRVLPGKAIDLLDEAAASVAISGKRLLEASDIENVVADKVKVPVSTAAGAEKDKLIKLEEVLHQRVIGQDEAVRSVAEAIRRARTLKRETKRPIGVFLFLGPTGVGKTETAKALSEVYFGSEEKIIRLDMSEFNQENTVYRLIGSPPGQTEYKEGGQLTEAVRVNPFSLILLDELEKAHPKVLEIFLAIFDEGRTTDSSGRTINFTNTIIIGTSNAGAEFTREEIQKNTNIENLKKDLIEKLLKDSTFRPEFLNRFDEVIVYKPLGGSEVEKIVTLMLQRLINRLAKQDLSLEIAPEVVSHLAQIGYDPTFGARPLQRTIQDQVESLISKALLENKLSRGSRARLIVSDNSIQISQ